MAPTFQYSRHISQPPVLSVNSLCWSAAHCTKMLSSYEGFIRGKRWKSQGAMSGQMMKDDQTLPIEYASGATFVAAAICSRALSWRTIPEDNIPSRLFWIKESIVLGMFMGSLCAQNWQVRCVTIDGHTRDIAQHLCTKLHMILTGVLISWLIRSWKKNSPHTGFLPILCN